MEQEATAVVNEATPVAQVSKKEKISRYQLFKDNLSIISLGLLILGTANLMVYYEYFNINILQYLEFTEVLQLQFRLFTYIIGLYGISTIFSLIHSKYTSDNKDTIREETNGEDKEKTTKAKPLNKLLLSLIVFTIIILIMASVTTIYKDIRLALLLLSIPFFTPLVFIAYKEAINKLPRQNAEESMKSAELYHYALIFAIVGFTVWLGGLILAVRCTSPISNNEVTVVMEKKTFSTSADYRYIGKTKGYIFFYTISKQQAEVYPIGDVKILMIRNGIDYKPNFKIADIVK
jgi:hypothetical protein